LRYSVTPARIPFISLTLILFKPLRNLAFWHPMIVCTPALELGLCLSVKSADIERRTKFARSVATVRPGLIWLNQPK
jgi:hypothetical protein